MLELSPTITRQYIDAIAVFDALSEATEEAAQRALTTLGNQGVRTARVVVERAEAPGFTLRLPALDSATRAQVETQLRPALGEKTLRTCP